MVKNLDNAGKFLMYPRSRNPKRKDTEVPQPSGATDNVADEVVGRYGDEEMFDTGFLDGDEVLAEPEVTVKDVNLSVDEVTLAQALAALKSAKVQEKANVLEELSESITTTPTLTTTTAATTITAVSTRPRAKGLVIHEEEQATTPTVSSQQPSQVKAQDKGKWIMVEEPVKMKKKDQISLDEELAFKLQAEEEEERLAREKDQREEKANIVAWDNMQAMIDTDYQMDQTNASRSQESDVIKEKSKFEVRAEGKDKETAELQRLIEVVPDKEEVAIDAIPLATKLPIIVDYKIHKEGKKTYYQIIKVDGSSKMYLVFSHMLKSFDREDWKPCTVFREPPYPFDYPMRRLTMEEILAKFIDEGRREHEEMEIFIKEFRTTNELLLKTRGNSVDE
ncbi:hypothetical protein Tco_0885609 [Tanacetum coccineum]